MSARPPRTADDVVRALRDCAKGVRSIRAHHRLRPHVFTEDKDELAHRLENLAVDLSALLTRRPPPAAKPTTGRVLPALHPA